MEGSHRKSSTYGADSVADTVESTVAAKLQNLQTAQEILPILTNWGVQDEGIALSSYIKLRQIHQAERMVEKCLAIEGEMPDLLLKKASLLGLQARYEEAASLLLSLNREYPSRPAILKRLVLVFEQLRDTGKAIAFLRAYSKVVPDDVWAQRKLEQFAALGVY